MKPVRRLVTIDDERGKSRAIADGPAPEVRADHAQPGVVSSLIWATDRTPARTTPALPDVAHTFAPPPGGSVCRIVTFAPHGALRPPMRSTRTLDFCLVLEGEITLVLDLEEVQLKAGEVVVQRGTRHAWSNRSARPCRLAISSHDAAEGRPGA
jgi:quercetin dioxygenase-like cupin family protein